MRAFFVGLLQVLQGRFVVTNPHVYQSLFVSRNVTLLRKRIEFREYFWGSATVT